MHKNVNNEINDERKLLICCDLDRTVIPNGQQMESPGARPLFRFMAGMPGVYLVYVTGRRKELIQEAVAEFYLPIPDFAVGDVGTSIYTIDDRSWSEIEEWDRTISVDWQGMTSDGLQEMFDDMGDLVLQEEEQQNRRKLSYYVDEGALTGELTGTMKQRLDNRGIRASIINSVDETKRIGLIDVLPESATKYHGVRFLMERLGFPNEQTLFAGDSGNDLPALTSGLQAVLVNNARDEVKEQAMKIVKDKGISDMLYLARGGFLGMNGNYSAGVLEGMVHYFPDLQKKFSNFLNGTGTGDRKPGARQG